jgi:hypothetical protein
MDPLAVYGATLATASVVWQIFTWWHKGAKLRGHASPNMIMIGGDVDDQNTYIGLDVSNVGDAPTTITNVVLLAYSNRFARLMRRTEVKAAVVNHSLAQTIPYTLPAGSRFMSRVIQAPEVVQWSRDHSLYMGVCHSMRRRPYLLRVRPIEEKK